jgi:hypothetical protein
VFTAGERDRVRERVFEIARADGRITGAAVTGSRSVGAEDRWSDVDTAFGFAADADPEAILRDWTHQLEREVDVVHRFDLGRAPTTYRVFLLSNGLELDISLTPEPEFGARGPNFRLVFGTSVEGLHASPPDIDGLIGWGWIYVLNSRAAIERGKPWQAAHYIACVRDHGLALASARRGLPAAYARGVDRLGSEVTTGWEATLVKSLEPSELHRALAVAAREFLREVGEARPELAARLREPLSLDEARRS